jgi:hypothetical protein
MGDEELAEKCTARMQRRFAAQADARQSEA